MTESGDGGGGGVAIAVAAGVPCFLRRHLAELCNFNRAGQWAGVHMQMARGGHGEEEEEEQNIFSGF